MDKDKLMEMDLYALLEVQYTATESEIKKAYRKKALKCHPDKNPDNPHAAAQFLEISTALEILLDVSAKGAYDRILNAKKAAKVRHQELDSRRKKLKEDLEAREKLAKLSEAEGGAPKFKTAEEKLKAEIDRLRKEGSKQLLEEMETVRKQIYEEKLRCSAQMNDAPCRLKVKWRAEKTDPLNGGYDTEKLTQIFSKYGVVLGIVSSQKKKGSALVEFETTSAAIQAHQLEKGFGSNPITLSWVDKPPIPNSNNSTPTPSKTGIFPSFSNVTSSRTTCNQRNYDDDFEAMVFAKMREAEEKKKATS